MWPPLSNFWGFSARSRSGHVLGHVLRRCRGRQRPVSGLTRQGNKQYKICHMTVYCLYLAKIQEPNCPAASVQNDHNDLHFRLSLRLHFRDRSKSGRRGRAQRHTSFLISVVRVHKVTIPQTRYTRKVPISEKRGQLSFGLPFIHSSIQQPCLTWPAIPGAPGEIDHSMVMAPSTSPSSPSQSLSVAYGSSIQSDTFDTTFFLADILSPPSLSNRCTAIPISDWL